MTKENTKEVTDPNALYDELRKSWGPPPEGWVEIDLSKAATASMNKFLQEGPPAKDDVQSELIRHSLESRTEKYKIGVINLILEEVEDRAALQRIFTAVATNFGFNLENSEAPTADNSESANRVPPPATPDRAPEIYRDRPDRRENAEEFLRRVYRPWLESGSIFQYQIGKLDPQLLVGLKNQFKGRADELRALIPHKSDEVSRRLAEMVGNEVTDPIARRRLVQAERSLASTIKKFQM